MEDEFGYEREERNFESDDTYDTFENFWKEYNDMYINIKDSPVLEDEITKVESKRKTSSSRNERARLKLKKKYLNRQSTPADEYGKEKIKELNDLNDKVDEYIVLKNEELEKKNF